MKMRDCPSECGTVDTYAVCTADCHCGTATVPVPLALGTGTVAVALGTGTATGSGTVHCDRLHTDCVA